MTVIMPAALALLLGSIFQPPGDMAPTSLLVVIEDEGMAGIQWQNALSKREDLNPSFVSREEATSTVARGLAPAAVFIPADATSRSQPESLSRGTVSRLRLMVDPAREVEGIRIRGILTECGADILQQRLMEPKYFQEFLLAGRQRLQNNELPLPQKNRIELEVVLQNLSDLINPLLPLKRFPLPPTKSVGDWVLQLEEEPFPETLASVRTGYHSHSHAFAGMICMFLLFFALERSKQELRERESGTLFRIKTTPVASWTLLLAPWLSTTLIALLSASITYLAGWVLVDVAVLGSFTGFLLLLLSMSWMVGGFSLLMSRLFHTHQALTSAGTLIVLLMSFVGGAWAPSFVLSDVLQQIGLWMPTSWATEGFASVTWRGLGIETALVPAGMLLLFGTGFGALSWLVQRWRIEG